MPVMASTGTWSSLASYRPFSRWMAPGPEVARQTPELAGGLGVGGGHERGRLLVVDQEELDPVAVPAQALHDPVDAVAGQAEDRVDPPVGQPLDQQLGCDLCHDFSLGGWWSADPVRLRVGGPELQAQPGPVRRRADRPAVGRGCRRRASFRCGGGRGSTRRGGGWGPPRRRGRAGWARSAPEISSRDERGDGRGPQPVGVRRRSGWRRPAGSRRRRPRTSGGSSPGRSRTRPAATSAAHGVPDLAQAGEVVGGDRLLEPGHAEVVAAAASITRMACLRL